MNFHEFIDHREPPMTSSIQVSEEMLAFLNGEGPLEGVWFGDKPEGERGNFWWRKHLPTKSLPQGDERLSEEAAMRELRLLYNFHDDGRRQFTIPQMLIAICHGYRLAALVRSPIDRSDDVREALDDLQQAEAEYRLMHDRHGGGASATGRAWDLMRRAGDKARNLLNAQDDAAITAIGSQSV